MLTHPQSLTSEWIEHYLLSNFTGLIALETYGEKTFFYNPNDALPRGIYFCTIKSNDGPRDKASDLSRPGVFRMNWQLSSQDFLELFDKIPKRPAKGQVIEGNYDFRQLGSLTPHPVYGWMRWVSVVNPTPSLWPQIEDLLKKSYALYIIKHVQRIKKDDYFFSQISNKQV